MEDGLGELIHLILTKTSQVVLILVLVEDGLGVAIKMRDPFVIGEVLILVLVEDGLGEPPPRTNA